MTKLHKPQTVTSVNLKYTLHAELGVGHSSHEWRSTEQLPDWQQIL